MLDDSGDDDFFLLGFFKEGGIGIDEDDVQRHSICETILKTMTFLISSVEGDEHDIERRWIC